MDTSRERNALRRARRHHSPTGNGPSVAVALFMVVFWLMVLIVVLGAFAWLIFSPPA